MAQLERARRCASGGPDDDGCRQPLLPAGCGGGGSRQVSTWKWLGCHICIQWDCSRSIAFVHVLERSGLCRQCPAAVQKTAQLLRRTRISCSVPGDYTVDTEVQHQAHVVEVKKKVSFGLSPSICPDSLTGASRSLLTIATRKQAHSRPALTALRRHTLLPPRCVHDMLAGTSLRSAVCSCGLQSGGARVCQKCGRGKPPRAHHCRVCRRCIRRMDHHCPWRVGSAIAGWQSAACDVSVTAAAVLREQQQPAKAQKGLSLQLSCPSPVGQRFGRPSQLSAVPGNAEPAPRCACTAPLQVKSSNSRSSRNTTHRIVGAAFEPHALPVCAAPAAWH